MENSEGDHELHVADLHAVLSSTPRDSVIRDMLHRHTLAMSPYTRFKDNTTVMGHIIHNVHYHTIAHRASICKHIPTCLLYTSDAADE